MVNSNHKACLLWTAALIAVVQFALGEGHLWIASSFNIPFTIVYIVFGVVIKHIVRNIFMTVHLEVLQKSESLRELSLILFEHTLFSAWAYYEVIVYPEFGGKLGSWFYHPSLCWTLPAVPVTGLLSLYYAAKTGTHTEDLLVMLSKYFSVHDQNENMVLKSEVSH